jgi:hypothetical protein
MTMGKAVDLAVLREIKEKVEKEIRYFFGAAANGPTFVKKFENIFTQAEADIIAVYDKEETDGQRRGNEEPGRHQEDAGGT